MRSLILILSPSKSLVSWGSLIWAAPFCIASCPRQQALGITCTFTVTTQQRALGYEDPTLGLSVESHLFLAPNT